MFQMMLCLGVIIWTIGSFAASAATRNIVLLFDERPQLPGLAMLDAEFDHTLTSGSTDSIEIYREAMDVSRFNSPMYRTLLRDFLRAKYAGKKIDVAVAIFGPALDFLLKYGDEIFPGTPIVFCGIDKRELDDRSLPSHVRGVLVKRRFAPTLEIALRIHHRTEQVVVVAGTSEFDALLLNQAREEFRPYESSVAFRYFTSTSLTQTLDQLSQFPPHTIVLFTTLFQDGAGETFVPHDVVERVSAIANAPVYGFLDQYLGRGIVGGSLYSVSAQGTESAKLVLQILAGAKLSAPSVMEAQANVVEFDWRQMQRWGISEASLPVNAQIRFRESSLWNQYRWHILIGLAALLAQAVIITGLVVERHRRRAAERISHRRTLEAIHLNRTATASALSASVAHELGQPLTAILNYATAADVHLSRDPPNIPILRKAVGEIQKSVVLATEIISHLRSLLRKAEEIEQSEFDFHNVIDAALNILRPEAARRDVAIILQECGRSVVRGDHVHLEQVILNLVANAMDALSNRVSDRREVAIHTSWRGAELEVAVSDTGTGIAVERLTSIFETFYTTKKDGTGLGLSITRTIIENHGGKIWAENGPKSGAVFKFTLPLSRFPAAQINRSDGVEKSGFPSDCP